jgi:hypothetical protein
MNLKASSEIESKPVNTGSVKEREQQIASRLEKTLRGASGRAIARSTGYNSETIRRYLNGDSKIPADFVAQVVRLYSQDVFHILDIERTILADDLRRVSLNLLMNEVSRRICRIEDYSVGSVLIGQQHPLDQLSTTQD